jgi:hypothetical protein
MSSVFITGFVKRFYFSPSFIELGYFFARMDLSEQYLIEDEI